MWDWKAGFKYWDANRNAPVPELPDAFFPRLFLWSRTPGDMEAELAIGKRIRILRATDIATPSWQPVHEEVNTSRIFRFIDPAPPQGQAFYALEWLK
jgi:hypothetical protein